MSNRAPEKARLRFLHALSRITEGLEIQRYRIMERTANAPKLLAGTESDSDITDLTGALGNDLDYYAYELGRLQNLAQTINRRFGDPQETAHALATFEAAIPNLRKIRNPLTHPSDDERLDDVAWFDSIVTLGPSGSVEYLIDPRYHHHDAAKELAQALEAYLESAHAAAGKGDPVAARGALQPPGTLTTP